MAIINNYQILNEKFPMDISEKGYFYNLYVINVSVQIPSKISAPSYNNRCGKELG